MGLRAVLTLALLLALHLTCVDSWGSFFKIKNPFWVKSEELARKNAMNSPGLSAAASENMGYHQQQQAYKSQPVDQNYQQRPMSKRVKPKYVNLDRDTLAAYFGLPEKNQGRKKKKQRLQKLEPSASKQISVEEMPKLDSLDSQPNQQIFSRPVPYQQPQQQLQQLQPSVPVNPPSPPQPAPQQPQSEAKPQGRDYGGTGEDRVRMKVYRGPTEGEGENAHAAWGFWVKHPPEAPPSHAPTNYNPLY
ncbi:unnamed protein product [Notodromas monacha]|uniref:Uncharacterized protein n=1 Tax=Notodromas monacha TaxID=399045 RepID=A0A7R9BTY7_9CRUS|nr:unnamed protein product [Notodromas monacha]CAG0921372.1 unnamed protein product [Notodromas monacha]